MFKRLIRSVKRCLRKIIGRAKLSLEELSTIVIEVEMVVNSSPLTHVSPTCLKEPVTPSHLLIGRRLLNLPESLSLMRGVRMRTIMPHLSCSAVE